MAVEPTAVTGLSASAEELDQLVKEADLGGREPKGHVGTFLAIVAAA